MHFGQVKHTRPFIFYFVIDPTRPDDPGATERKYYLVTDVCSAEDAFYGLIRKLYPTDSKGIESVALRDRGAATHYQSNPLSDKMINKWFHVFDQTFNHSSIDHRVTSLDTFRKNLRYLPTSHMYLELSELSALKRAADIMRNGGCDFDGNNTCNGEIPTSITAQNSEVRYDIVDPDPSIIYDYLESNNKCVSQLYNKHCFRGVSPCRSARHRAAQTGDLVYAPTHLNHLLSSDNNNTAIVESPNARLRKEISMLRLKLKQVEAHLVTEQTRNRVDVLCEAERAAFNKRIEELLRELAQEKEKGKRAGDSLRGTIKTLEQRLENLTFNQDATLKDRAAAEISRMSNLELTYLQREGELKKETEHELQISERKLVKALNRVRVFQEHLQEALTRIEEQKVLLRETQLTVVAVTSEKKQLDEQNNRLSAVVSDLERQLEQLQRDSTTKSEELQRLRKQLEDAEDELCRFRREQKSFCKYQADLHKKLGELDENANQAARLIVKADFAPV